MSIKLIVPLAATFFIQACSSEQESTERTKTRGGHIEYTAPNETSELPTIDLQS